MKLNRQAISKEYPPRNVAFGTPKGNQGHWATPDCSTLNWAWPFPACLWNQDCLTQKPANYSSLTKFSLPPVLWIKFYSNTDMAMCFCIISGLFHTIVAELSRWNRDRMVHKASNIWCGLLEKKFAQTWFKLCWVVLLNSVLYDFQFFQLFPI